MDELLAGLLLRYELGSTVLHAPGNRSIGAGQWLTQVEHTVAALRQRGIGAQHRVAAVLPPGSGLAVSFLAVSAAAAFAPLNPNYTETEFLFYLSDLDAKALLTAPGFCPAAEAAAATLRIPLLALESPPGWEPGSFQLSGPPAGPPIPLTERTSDRDVALLLHSSGTTARPKLIPLTHRNLRASGANIARTLRLGPEDICLNLMPLFHIHGLVGALLSSLSAGSQIFCPDGFNAFRFGQMLDESRATWCTAVPTMYQAVLSRRKDPSERFAGARLRFLRSSSAPLHTPVWQSLENLFDCRVLNSYGMTEASHQMASNPLPPAERSFGTVGLAAGPEIAIAGENGQFLTPGSRGEIVIRGNTVTSGYLSPVAANLTAFRDGWFLTGDEGQLDEQGYLTLLGRLKEQLNVGGEKIAPAEIDEALMLHPAVRQAVAFGVPCPLRGERIYAAVVLDADADESSIRRFALDRLAKFKVPEKILIVSEIPKGPTGKLQRIGLAAKLGIS